MDDGNRCKCDGVISDEGILCNTATKQCANKLEGDCHYNASETSKNTICNNGRMMTCTSSNLWESGNTCEHGCNADASNCAECHENTCEGNHCIECNGGVKQAAVACAQGCSKTGCETECTGAECNNDCTDGQTLCSDGKIKTCSKGACGAEQSCPNDASCSSCLNNLQ